MSIKPLVILLTTILILATSIFLATTKLRNLLPLTSTSSSAIKQFIRTSTSMPSSQSLNFELRKSYDRGKADHGWLKSFHTFSFADYYSPKFEQFGPLRVINEDRVAPGTGFPTHRVLPSSILILMKHREFEIFSYILNGELSHRDNMNNVETLKRGDVQYTTGGTGIAHSEYNNHPSEEVHFLQIW
jgi:quercetin 2,3-dioxygenase